MKKYKVYSDISVIYRFIKDAEKEGFTEDEALKLLDDFTISYMDFAEDLEDIIRSYIIDMSE